MTIDRSKTPLPAQRLSPIQVEVADWLDLPANDNKTVVNVTDMSGQVMDVRKIGGRPETDVSVVIEAGVSTKRGSDTIREEVESSALRDFGSHVASGPVATDSLTWTVQNRSANTFDDAGNNPYQTWINYVVRNLTIAEKLSKGIPINKREERIAKKYNIQDMQKLNVPISSHPLMEPNVNEKDVVERESKATTLDIQNTGSGNPVTVATERNLSNRGLVAYITGLEINSQNYTENDDLIVQFVRGGTNNFFRLETNGLPGYTNDYKADLHIPFLSKMGVNIFAQNAINNVDVKLEYVLVTRNLIEKAIHGLENEIISNDDMADARFDIYNKLRERMEAGVDIEPVIEGIEFSKTKRAAGVN